MELTAKCAHAWSCIKSMGAKHGASRVKRKKFLLWVCTLVLMSCACHVHSWLLTSCAQSSYTLLRVLIVLLLVSRYTVHLFKCTFLEHCAFAIIFMNQLCAVLLNEYIALLLISRYTVHLFTCLVGCHSLISIISYLVFGSLKIRIARKFLL